MTTIIQIHPIAADPPLGLPPLEPGDAYSFHTMVKLSGAQCNLDCTYCYYLHKEDLLQQSKLTRMNESMLEAHVRQYITAQTITEVVFSWQGGEPTLMGLEFFQRIVELQEKHKKTGQRIENDLQTNGILLNDEWCLFLKKNNFQVGISIDGPSELHDIYRRSKGDEPTFTRVMKSVELLHKWKISFNTLTVVNRINARRPNDTYRFLRDKVRPRMIQFIPGVEPANFEKVAPGHWNPETLPFVNSLHAKPGNPESLVTEWSVDSDDWGYFLTRIWDEWLRRDFGKIFIDQFENVISQMFGYGAQKCTSAEICGKALAIEHNGDLYSCDHYVYDEYKLGNIAEMHEGDMAFSERQKQFAYAKSLSLPKYCKSCNYLKLCWGECPRNRFIKTLDGEPGLNYLCNGLKQFYTRVTASRQEVMRRLDAPTANTRV